MATAVEPGTQAAPSNPKTRLVLASVTGAAVVLAGVAVAAYVVPQAWHTYVSPSLAQVGSLADGFLRLVAQLAAVVVFASVATTVGGKNPPHGVRGGIFLVVSAAIALFFVVRAVGLNLEDSSLAQYASIGTCIALGVLLALVYRGLMSDRGQQIMHAIDDQGLLHLFSYKRTQGLKARRYTLLGLLLLGWSGVYSLVSHDMLGDTWLLRMPFTDGRLVPVLTDVAFVVPILLAAAVFWLAWRAVNMPAFADFLIATEAEMNKVSWSTRKRLVQDTIVVLLTVLIMTVFFLVIDFFWGWLLSRDIISVLPTRTPTTENGRVDPVQGRQTGW